MPRTDSYSWTITSGTTFQQGTFLCGEPWVVDNGDLTLTAVSPSEIVITDNTLSSFPSVISGPSQIAVLNPDPGKRAWNSTYQNANFAVGYPNRLGQDESDRVWCKDGMTTGAVSGDAIPSVSNRYDDFRSGSRLSYNNQTGIGFYPENGITFPLSIEAGDMVCLSYGYTGELIPWSGGAPWTESRAVITVLSSAPGASAFRPPINWDPTLKANRPIYNEVYDLRGGAGGTAYEWQFPDYNFTSDTKTWTDTTPARRDLDTVMNKTSPIFPMACHAVSEMRGTNVDQGISDAEYGSDISMWCDSMLLHVFDPNVSGATQDLLRRTLVQRGIDIWGSVYGTGAYLFMQGGHSNPYGQMVYLAWCATGDPAMYNFLNTNSMGTAGNNTYWEQKVNPAELLFGDYNDSIHENGHLSRNNKACSFRHFDMVVTEQGTADNLHYVKVARPVAREDAIGAHGGTVNFPLWTDTESGNAAGANWGWANNSSYVDTGIINGAWIRVKGQSGGGNYSAITRVVDAAFYNGSGATATSTSDRENPASAIFWLQDDIIPEDGGITGADLNNAIESTRAGMWTPHSTSGLRQTGCEGGKIAYGYASIDGCLNRWRLGSIRGYANLPYWGKREYDKSVWMATNILGKNYFINAQSGGYNHGGNNPEGSLYHALMRWGPADGASLPHVPPEYERSYQSYPAGGTAAVWKSIAPTPASPSWEEIEWDLTKIKVWTEGNNEADGGGIGWYRYNEFGGASAGSTYANQLARNSTYWTNSNGKTEFRIKSNNGEQHSLFDFATLGWDLYVWPSLSIRPYKLTLTGSNASGPTDISWEDTYEVAASENISTPENQLFSKEFGWTFVAAESGFSPIITNTLTFSTTHPAYGE